MAAAPCSFPFPAPILESAGSPATRAGGATVVFRRPPELAATPLEDIGLPGRYPFTRSASVDVPVADPGPRVVSAKMIEARYRIPGRSFRIEMQVTNHGEKNLQALRLVLFAGNAYIQMPLTTDHGAAKLFVATANPGAITAQGTAIGDALEKSSLAFGEESERFKAVVLVTDGESHDENAAIEAQEQAVARPAPGAQGHVSPAEAVVALMRVGASGTPRALLWDPE